MKKLLLTFVLLAVSLMSEAGHVTPDQAIQSVQAFMNRHPHLAKGRARLAHQQPRVGLATETAAYYVFNIGTNAGFVVVSGDDRTPAILGYATQGTFDERLIPDNMRAWLQGYADQIAFMDQHPQVRVALRNEEEDDKADIDPMITTLWNQDSPFNILCPIDPSTDQRCVTGCVATAMAQIMNFHHYPDTTIREIPAYVFGTPQVSVDSIPAGTRIDWDNMVDDYSNATTTTQDSAVATLMQLCGASVQMQYGSDVSSAASDYCPLALKYYFGYASSARDLDRNNYSTDEWEQIIYDELLAGRPVLYGGQSSGGGHAFVVDGYSTDGLFHINWGWGGFCDNYFLLSILNPGDNSGIGASNSTDGYSFDQDVVIGITPREGECKSDVRLSIYELQLLSDKKQPREDDGTYCVEMRAQMYNMTGDKHTFRLGLGVYDENDELVELFDYDSVELNANWGWSRFDASAYIGNDLPEGTYKLKMISCEEGEDDWKPDFGSNVYYMTATIGGDTAVITPPSISLSGTITVEKAEVGIPTKLIANIQNNGTDFMDDIYFSIDGQTKGGTHLELPGGESTTIEMEFTPQSAGTHVLKLHYKDLYGWQVLATDTINVEDVSPIKHLSYAFDLANTTGNVLTTPMAQLTVHITNDGGSVYSNDVLVFLLKDNGSGYYQSVDYKMQKVTLANAESTDVVFEFGPLDDNWKYAFSMQYISNNKWVSDYNYMFFSTKFATVVENHLLADFQLNGVDSLGMLPLREITGTVSLTNDTQADYTDGVEIALLYVDEEGDLQFDENMIKYCEVTIKAGMTEDVNFSFSNLQPEVTYCVALGYIKKEDSATLITGPRFTVTRLTTAVEYVATESQQTKQRYDLQGRRINRTTPRTIYIKNGRKYRTK